MVSKYDVFYVIATKGEIRVIDIVDALHKNKEEYRSIFNQVLKLEKENLVYRNEAVRPSKDPSSVQLFQLIRFCVDNGMNYNLMLKPTMIEFIEQAARKEFFTTKDITSARLFLPSVNSRYFSIRRLIFMGIIRHSHVLKLGFPLILTF